MPWKKDKDGKQVYIPGSSSIANKDACFYSLNSQRFANRYFSDAQELSDFFLKEMLKPIIVNNQVLDSKEKTKAYLEGYKGKPFDEATRGGSMLASFCYANGMEMDDLLLMKNDPENPKCDKLFDTFEDLRHKYYEMVCCDDKQTSERLVTDYYVKLMDRTEKAINKFANKDDLDIKDFSEYALLVDNYHSLGVQTLKIGYNDPVGLHHVDLINQDLKAEGKPYNFNSFFNLGLLGSRANQKARKIKENLNQEQGVREMESDELESATAHNVYEMLNEFKLFKDFFKKDGKTIAQKIADFNDEKAFDIRLQETEDEPKITDEVKDICFEEAYKAVDGLEDFSKEKFNALMQEERQGIFGTKENSKEFNAVKNTFKDYLKNQALPEGKKPSSTDLDVYNACKAYIAAKDGSPKTAAGKERLAAVSNLMTRMGAKIIDNNPEKADEINKDFNAFTKKSSIFKNEIKAVNEKDFNNLSKLEKYEVKNISNAMKEGANVKSKQKLIDSMSKLVTFDYIKRLGNSQPVSQYMDSDFIQQKADSLKPFINNLIKTGDAEKINKAIFGENPSKDLSDVFVKNFNAVKNKSLVEAEYQTEKMQEDVMLL